MTAYPYDPLVRGEVLCKQRVGAWLGDAPTDLLAEIDFKQAFQATVTGNTATYDSEHRAAVIKTLKPYLSEGKIGDTQAVIKKVNR